MVGMFLPGYENYAEKRHRLVSEVFQRRCRLFDYLIGNSDRGGKNMMVRETHEVAIDHAFSFDPDGYILTEFIMHEDDLKFVKQLRVGPVLDFLSSLLLPQSVERFVTRLALLPKTRVELRKAAKIDKEK